MFILTYKYSTSQINKILKSIEINTTMLYTHVARNMSNQPNGAPDILMKNNKC